MSRQFMTRLPLHVPLHVHYGPVLPPGNKANGACKALPPGTSFHPRGSSTALFMRRADPATLHTLHGQAMGTTWCVRLDNPQFIPLETIRAAIEQALVLVVQQMSNWEVDSDISRFSRAPAGTWHTLPAECFTVLACALDWARQSDGALDPTIGPLVDIWGFGPRATPQMERPACMPDAAALALAQARVGHHRIRLNLATRQALQPGGVQVDLCGIAKGYSVDLVAQSLKAQGITDFLVEVGGELRASGQRPDGLPWRVAIATTAREGSDAPPLTLPLHNTAIATSGDLWHAFDLNGRRYSHTLDSRSGAPVAHSLVCVTVLHAECMHADALATVLTVLGPREGVAFATAHGIAALLCERTAVGIAVTTTPAWNSAVPCAQAEQMQS